MHLYAAGGLLKSCWLFIVREGTDNRNSGQPETGAGYELSTPDIVFRFDHRNCRSTIRLLRIDRVPQWTKFKQATGCRCRISYPFNFVYKISCQPQFGLSSWLCAWAYIVWSCFLPRSHRSDISCYWCSQLIRAKQEGFEMERVRSFCSVDE